MVLCFLVVGVVTGGLVHLLHGYQFDQNADALKLRAVQLKDAGEAGGAIRRYRQYVKIRPQDIEAWTALGKLLDETAETPREYLQLYLANEQILRLNPSSEVVRRKQAETAMALRRFSDAGVHWGLLQKSAPKDGEIDFQLGLCEEYSGQPAEAMRHYRLAVDHGHNSPLVYLRMARLLRGPLDQQGEADQLISQMMESHPKSAEAYRTRALYRRALNMPAEALADAREAARRDPDDVDSLLLLAALTVSDPKATPKTLDGLLETLETRLDKSPKEIQIYELMARIQVRRGKRKQAIETLSRGRDADPKRTGLAWQLADLLIVEGRVEEARQELARLRKQEAPEIPLLFLEARILMADGEFVEAKQRLERVKNNEVNRESLLLRSAGLHLGACYGRMGQYDKQLDACRQVLKVAPQSMEAKLGIAAALESLGRPDGLDEAIQIYRTYRAVPGVSLRLARLLFSRELRRPKESRNWQPIEEALQVADATASGSVDVALLRSALLRVRGGVQPPQPTVAVLKRDQPKDIRVWVSSAMSAMRDAKWEKSLELLDEAENSLGDSVTLRLARAAYWSRIDEKRAKTALVALEGKLDDFSKTEQLRLLEGLATVHFLRSDTRTARRLWTEVATRYPDHVRAQFRLLRLAIGMGDDSEIKLRLQKLGRIEGKDGPHVLVGRALHLIARARGEEAVVLEQSRDLLILAARAQRDWAIIPLAQAELAELNGNLNEALAHYLRVIELENRDPDVLRRTIALLLSRRRVAEAKRLILQLFDNAPVSMRGQLQQLQVEVAIVLRDIATAKRQIPIAAPAESKSYRLQLWRGRMLTATNQIEEAAKAFDTAIKLAPKQSDVWVEQVAFLSRTGRKKEAEAATTLARLQLSGPGSELAMARCYEAIGDRDQAEQSYRKLSADAKSVGGTRTMIEFYLRTAQTAKAELLLKRLLKRKGENQLVKANLFWVRRSLATVKASQDYSQFREALALLNLNITAGGDSTDDQRLKAHLLATRPHPGELRDAKGILESLDPNNLLRPQDRRLLATICDRLGDKQASSKHWSQLVAEEGDQPQYVAEYINRLLRDDDLDAAETWLDQLTKLEPDSLRTAALRARWLVLQKRTDDALKLLNLYAANQHTDADLRSIRLLRVAQVLEQLAGQCDDAKAERNLIAAAEKLYVQPIEQRPEMLLQLAMYLSRQGRRDEALDRCQESRPTVPALQVTAMAVVIVRHPEASDEQIERVDRWLKEAVRDNPESISALIQLAEFRLSHERYEESIKIYRGILERLPNHVVALNNLAWLLSVWKGDHTTADKLMKRAIDRAGPLAALLDTRGSIAVGRGDLLQAVDDFRNVVAQDNSAAARYHLALAYWKSKNRPAARFNFERAVEQGLKIDDLYPLERDDYEKLRAGLQVEKVPAGKP